jgi:flavin reductase (DIM6/NTAB) family NADH-FMN oxidoreductase RutF
MFYLSFHLNFILKGQLVVNIMSTWYIESANHASGAFPPGENEMEFAGMTAVPSTVVKPPRVGEAAVQLECEVFSISLIPSVLLLYLISI